MAALPLLALALASAALDAAPDLPWTVGVAVAGLFLVAGAARALQSYLELRRLRATADRLILRPETRRRSSPLLDWRSGELTDPAHRHALARSVRHVVRELSPAVLPGASPLNRPAVRPHAGRLAELAALLDDPAREITARGVLLLEALLCEPGSSLYRGNAGARVGDELGRVARALTDLRPSPAGRHDP